ncbi:MULTISPECIES: hypothetical protein [Bartonella]|uniref:hypothetical protein n=1 Tax=Bartonella TaxID=773 RepID=UPI00235E812F|nr:MULTISPECIES: hypothetical protein [Bartonella]
MMQEWIKILLTGFMSFAVSLSVALILRNKDRKEATKIRKEDLEKSAKKRKEDLDNIERQLEQLKNQTEAAKEHVSILWAEKQIRDLGPKLKVTIKEATAHKYGKDFFIEVHVIIENPTEQTMRINNFRLHNENLFALNNGGFLGKHPMYLQPENEKYIPLTNPFVADLESQIIFDCFNLDAHEETEFTFTVRHLKPDIVSTPIFIIEHTSSNHAEKVLETTFWPNFLLPFEESSLKSG